ncbi:MAG: hypothetical protein H6658_11615 [Ardenticatenaceae bacterium]|nr:hypothetical protein [Ardenticatenaceae bacterium]
MYAQVTCPRCGTPFQAEIHQMIDVGQHPELKMQLLNGALNVAVCPNCGAGTQLSTPLVYHDSEHQLFMIHVPQEMNVTQVQREEMIGRFTRQVMDATPQEQRRAYLFQPQMILTMQTFMEKVLETEGITKEMINKQQRQVELLQKLLQADKDVADYLLKERGKEIDEEFFAILQTYLDAAQQMNDNKQLLPLLNLRARLMTETAVGRRLEARQTAVVRLSKEAQKQGGLSPELLLKHIVNNQKNMEIVETLAMSGQAALTYEFFQLLTDVLDKETDKVAVGRLTEIRKRLLEFQEALRQQSQQMVMEADKLLQQILQSPDKQAAVRANLNRIDDAFMYVLSNRIAQADQQGKTEQAKALNDLYGLIMSFAEQQAPPEVQLLNDLMEAESEAVMGQLLDEHEDLLSKELVQVVDMLRERAGGEGQEALNGRLGQIKTMIQSRLN